MPGFLKGSVFVRLMTACFSGFLRAYASSKVKVFADGCSLCFKNCMIYRLCSKYFHKPFYFEYSLTLRFIKWLVRLFDVPMSLIGRFVRYITGGSLFVSSGNALAGADIRGKLTATGIIGVFISVGFALGSLIKGAASENFIIPALLLLLSVIILVSAKNFDWIKNSVIYRFIVWLVKA